MLKPECERMWQHIGPIMPTGLGQGDTSDYLVPTLIHTLSEQGIRIGRYRGLDADAVLAFAMATHPRLGRKSAFHLLLDDLVRRVVLLAGSPAALSLRDFDTRRLLRLLGSPPSLDC